MKKVLQNNLKSYMVIFLIGTIAGVICRMADYCPSDTLWSFSSIQTLFGFWIISNTLIVLLSSSNVCAGVSSFLYMFGMTISFYLLKFLLGFFISKFSGEFMMSLFIIYSILAVGCGIGAFILYYWEKNISVNSILYALPTGLLLAETMAVMSYLIKHSTFLFQLIMDGVAVCIFGVWFFKMAKNKILYIVSICVVTSVAYVVIYRSFL